MLGRGFRACHERRTSGWPEARVDHERVERQRLVPGVAFDDEVRLAEVRDERSVSCTTRCSVELEVSLISGIAIKSRRRPFPLGALRIMTRKELWEIRPQLLRVLMGRKR